MRISRESGEGTVIYFGSRRGSPFIGWSLRGFDGWSGSKWLPGGWAFFTPHLHLGRLFTDRKGRWYSRRVLLPAKPVDWYQQWKWRRMGLVDDEPLPRW